MSEDHDESVRIVPGPPEGVAVAPATSSDPGAVVQATPEAPPVKRAPSYLAHTIEEIPPADGAEILANLEPHEAAQVAETLDPETAGGVLSQMNAQDAAAVIGAMEPPEAAMVLTEMNPDDAVDVLGHFDQPHREALLDEMGAAEAADVRTLRQFAPDSAGGIMTTDITALPQDLTAQQAIDELRRLNETLEQMFYVYVVDRARRLVGVLSMRDLILARPDRRIADIMRRNVVAVPATMDQEDVSRLIRKYKYVAVPFIMKWLGFDPAQSATIFATTVTDCCGFFATLGLASIAIRVFGLHT
jgi:magnesium transporter